MKHFLAMVFGVVLLAGTIGCATTKQSVVAPKEQELLSRISALEEEIRSKDDEIKSLQNMANRNDDYSASENVSVNAKPTVKNIQAALKNAGYYSGNVDGKAGKNTRKAVIAFQKASGLKGDGVVGKKTWIALKKHL